MGHRLIRAALALGAAARVSSLVAPPTMIRAATLSVGMLPPRPGDPMSPEMMKNAADAMQNLTPDQISTMLDEVENMGPEEKKRLESMGINPAMLKMSMKVMKANPNVIKMAQDQMSKMSPQDMQKASDLAAKQMESMSPEDLERMADEAARAPIPAPRVTVDATVAAAAPGAARDASDAALVNALYTVGAAMGDGSGVTLAAFEKLPPVASLLGDLPDDLTAAEVAEAWTDAGLDVAAAADAAAFAKAWANLDDLYDDDLMVEARRPPRVRPASA